jgi:protein-S-isoprenylcysteine O-methyltransferase Ste14
MKAIARLRSGFILSLQLLPGMGLMLFGWGFDDLSGFFRNPARAGLVVVVLSGAVAGVFFGLDFHPLRRGATQVGGQNLPLVILSVLSLSLLWFLPFADRRGILKLAHSYWRFPGLLLCCVGVVVRLFGLVALGEYFSAYVTLQPGHRLVKRGIYRYIRHPLYLSLLLAPAGMALVFASYLALPISFLAAGFVWDRIGKEERLLAAHFGAEFEDYRGRTWMLVPFVI